MKKFQINFDESPRKNGIFSCRLSQIFFAFSDRSVVPDFSSKTVPKDCRKSRKVGNKLPGFLRPVSQEPKSLGNKSQKPTHLKTIPHLLNLFKGK